MRIQMSTMTSALAEMDKKKITKLVLDLRDNPGGEVRQAVLVAKKFVPKGLITKLDYKSEKYSDIEYNSDLEKTKYKLGGTCKRNECQCIGDRFRSNSGYRCR